jgi:PAS domain S-box-containing protein
MADPQSTGEMAPAMKDDEPGSSAPRGGQPPLVLRYGSAVLSTALGNLLRIQLDPVLEHRLPFVIYFIAVIFTAWYGGLGPAIFAMALGAVAADYFFIQPRLSFGIAETADVISLFFYLLVGLTGALLSESLRRARHRAGVHAQQAEERAHHLEQEMVAREQLEKTLRESHRLRDAILNSTYEGIIAQGPDGQYLFANDIAARLLGFPDGEMLRQVPSEEMIKAFEMMDEQGQPLPISGLPGRRALKSGENQERVVRLRRSEGGPERWLIVRAKPVKGEDGRVSFVVNVFQDITTIKQAEATLRESEERLRLLIETAPGAIVVANTDGQVVLVNKQVEGLFLYDPEELMGQPLERLMPARFRDVHVLHRARYLADPVPRMMGNGLNLVGRRKDGSEFPIEVGLSTSRVQDEVLMLAFIVDITARKQHEQAQQFLSEASDILFSSLDYKVTLARVARLVVPRIADWCAIDLTTPEGVERVAVVHTDPDKILLARDLERQHSLDEDTRGGLGKVLLTGEPELYKTVPDTLLDEIEDEELRATIRGLGLKSIMIVPLIARGRTLGGLTLVSAESERLFDETDLELSMELSRRAALAVDNAWLYKKTREQREVAEQANETKMKFMATVAHELRTPLTSIKGFASALLAKDTVWEPGKRQKYIEIIVGETDRLRDLIEQLMDFSRLEAGVLSIQPEPTSLAQIVDKARPSLTMLEGDCKLTINLPDDLPTVNADGQRVVQVLTNLVNNAAKYSPEGSTITLSAYVKQGNIQVDVSDEGPGIPAEDRERVFQAFHQVGSHPENEAKGLGLGLTIVKGLVEAHGGQIWIAEQPGPGTTFCFTLPATGESLSSALLTP